MNRNTLFGTTLERKYVTDLPNIELTVNDDNPEKAEVTYDKTDYEQHKAKLREIDKNLKLKYESSLKVPNPEGYELPKIPKDTATRHKRNGEHQKNTSLKSVKNETGLNSTYTAKNKALEYFILKHVEQRHRKLKDIRDTHLSNRIHLNSSGIEIPRNICHQYKYVTCDEILTKDQGLKVLEPIKYKEKIQRNLNQKDLILSEYDSLGMIMRLNVLPLSSLPEANFTSYNNYYNGWKTFENRDTTLPKQYRFKSDELSKWSCASIVDKRIFKEWQDKYDEMMKNKVVE